MSLPRDLSTLTEAHIAALITDQAVEGTYLDFKRDLPDRNEGGRHEFLADVSAFANSSGGDLVYGLDENGAGQAMSVVAQTGNQDQEARRLQDVLLHGVQPRIPGVQVQPVTVTGGFVLVVRVPQSWAGPHRVNTNQHFFIRENTRKRQLDVPEIGGLFLRSQRQAEQIRNFRRSFNLDNHEGVFDRTTLVLPDMLLPAETQAEQALRPVFDLVWQSAGIERSLNYNEAGEWSRRYA